MIATIRDIAIIFLAVEAIIILILMALLLFQMRQLIFLINKEIKPMMEATQETANTVRSTTQFVSKRIVKPGIDAISFGAGVRQAVATLKKRVASPGTPRPAEAPFRPPQTPPPAPADTPTSGPADDSSEVTPHG